MHCYICDFSNTAPSDYYLVLHHTNPSGNTVLRDRKTGKYVCSDCMDRASQIYEGYENLNEDSDGEVEVTDWDWEADQFSNSGSLALSILYKHRRIQSI